jgi:signal transduction histidine kinase
VRSPRPLAPASLALRITITFAVGALLVSTVLAVSAAWFTLNLLTHQQERDALRQAYLNAAVTRGQLQASDADVPAILDALTTPASSEAVLYTAGRWYSSSLLLSRDALPIVIRQDALAGEVVWQWANVAGRPQIVVGVPLRSSDSAYFQFFDQSALRNTRSVLTTVLVIAAGAATLAGAGVGLFVSRRLTAPLRGVGDAAERIAAGDLGLRLPEARDQELAHLVRSFNQMVATLASRIERDARFTADVSHELRSPLTTLSTSLAVLGKRSGELSAPGQEALRLVTAETVRFSRLVEDLLEISRVDALAADVEPVRLGQLLRNILKRAEYQGIQVDSDEAALDAAVAGDKRRLEQVFRNLLDNASEHAGGATLVSVRADRDRVVVYVDDAGPGVPAVDRERIFERFARGQAAARGSKSGTGLGLALVCEHVTAHHGTVSVTDAPSGGARFVVDLPRWMP